MEIKIEAHRLVEILIKAGIEPAGAKSLVFDILSEQNGVKLVQDIDNTDQVLIKRPISEKNSQKEEDDEFDSEKNEVVVKTNTPRQNTITKVKQSGQTMDFSRFGGNFNGINNR